MNFQKCAATLYEHWALREILIFPEHSPHSRSSIFVSRVGRLVPLLLILYSYTSYRNRFVQLFRTPEPVFLRRSFKESESIPGLHKRLQIRAQASFHRIDSVWELITSWILGRGDPRTKSIPAIKINILWDIADSILYLVLTQFQESIFLP